MKSLTERERQLIYGNADMTIKEAYDILKGNRDLLRFNPMTGEKQAMCSENELFAQACDVALSLFERYIK